MPPTSEKRAATAAAVAIGLYGAWLLSQRAGRGGAPFGPKQTGVDQGLGELTLLPCAIERSTELGASFTAEWTNQQKDYRAAFGDVAGGSPRRMLPNLPKECLQPLIDAWRKAWVTAGRENPERFRLAEPIGGDEFRAFRRGVAVLSAFGGLGSMPTIDRKVDRLEAIAGTTAYLKDGALPTGFRFNRLGRAVDRLERVREEMRAAPASTPELVGDVADAIRSLAIALDARGFSEDVLLRLEDELARELVKRSKALPSDAAGAAGRVVVGAAGAGLSAAGEAVGAFLGGLFSSPGTLVFVGVVAGGIWLWRSGGAK